MCEKKGSIPKETTLYGVRVPMNEWFGIGAIQEFSDGKGEEDDDK